MSIYFISSCSDLSQIDKSNLDNVDYNEIKHFIKQQTIAPTSSAVSIPGQHETPPSEQGLENELYAILVAQYQRVELFVQSKFGEISRRMEHLARQVDQTKTKAHTSNQNTVPGRRVERFSRLETEILKVGGELQSLGRFIAAQKLAFVKLLKKYKKWTKCSRLESRIRLGFLDRPENFMNKDLQPSIARYADILGAVREAFENTRSTTKHGKRALPSATSSSRPMSASSGGNSPSVFSGTEAGAQTSSATSASSRPLRAATVATRKQRNYPTAYPIIQTTRHNSYWNEFDNPESGPDDEAYTILVDPNAPGPISTLYNNLVTYIKPRKTAANPLAESTATQALPDCPVPRHNYPSLEFNVCPIRPTVSIISSTSSSDDETTTLVKPHPSRTRRYSTFSASHTHAQQKQDTALAQSTAMCFLASLVLLLLAGILVITRRKRYARVAQIGSLVGGLMSVVFLGVAVVVFAQRCRGKAFGEVGWFRIGLMGMVSIGLGIGNGVVIWRTMRGW